MGYSKVVYGNTTLIDLTADTVQADKLANGYTAHGKNGELVTGTNTYDADTSDATAAASEILDGKTAYVTGSKVTGTMTNRGSVSGSISTVAGQYNIQSGYHDGGGTVGIDATEQAKIIAGNIKNGVQILGVTGTYGGETAKVQAKTVEAVYTDKEQTILPDSGYDYLSQVTVPKIAYVETPNAQGGTTVTIGTVSPA